MTVEEVFAKVLREPVTNILDTSSPTSLRRWDSMNNIQLVIALEDTFGVKFATAEIPAMKTVGEVKVMLRKKGVAV